MKTWFSSLKAQKKHEGAIKDVIKTFEPVGQKGGVRNSETFSSETEDEPADEHHRPRLDGDTETKNNLFEHKLTSITTHIYISRDIICPCSFTWPTVIRDTNKSKLMRTPNLSTKYPPKKGSIT